MPVLLANRLVPKADLVAPSNPTITATGVTSSTASVTLTAPASDTQSGVASYELQYKASVLTTWVTDSSTLTAADFPRTVGGLSQLVSYDFRCRARDFAGNVGNFSTVSTTTTPDTTAPSTPAITASATSTIAISAALTTPSTDTGGSGVATYELQYKRTADSTYTVDSASLTQANFPRAISGLQAGTSYDTRARSTDVAGNVSNFSAVSQTTTQSSDTIAPTAPFITATALSSSVISVDLTTPSTDIGGSGVATYRLEYKRTADSTWSVDSAALTAASFPRTISGLVASTSYDARCRATDNSGNVGGYSAIQSVSTQASSGSSLWSYAVPTQTDEQAFYDNVVGWIWTAGTKTSEHPSSYGGPGGSGYDIHGNTEGDDLWSFLHAYNRTGLTSPYLNWATGWESYFESGAYLTDITSTQPEAGQTPHPDHGYGQGLILWARQFSDAGALTAAGNIAAVIEASVAPYNIGSSSMAFWGARGCARWMIVAAYIAEYTGLARWVTLRNKLIDLWVASPDFQAGLIGGMHFYDRLLHANYNTAGINGAAYDAGSRAMGAFHIGLMTEAFWRAYLATSRADVRTRLENMAWWAFQYAHIPTHVNPMVGSYIGHISSAARYHTDADSGNTNIKGSDPVYDTALVNLLVVGYKLTGYLPMLTMAQKLFRNGTIWASGSPIYGNTAKLVGDSVVHHYVDTQSIGGVEFDYNNGELQYCYLLFENGGVPAVLTGA